jgi:hypothetical protein
MQEPDAVLEVQESIAAIEAKARADMKTCPDCPQVPFGYANKQWRALKSRARDGDSILFYKNGRRFWNSLAGAEGYALIRDG